MINTAPTSPATPFPQNILRRWGGLLWPLSFFLAGFCGMILPLVTNGFAPGDIGDARFNLYVLEHFFRALTGAEPSFLNAPFLVPWPLTISFSDTHWGTAFIYAFFRSVGCTTTDAFRGWFVVGNVLNFIVAYFFLRRFGLRDLGAALGAFLFSFNLPFTAQLSHAQLTYRCAVPAAVFFWHRYLISRRPTHASLALLFIALQTICTIYIGVFLVYLLIAWSLAYLVWKKYYTSTSLAQSLRECLPKWETPAATLRAGGIFLLAGGLLLLAFLPYVELRRYYAFHREWSVIKAMLPRWSSYLLSDSSFFWSWNWPFFSALPFRWEHQMFPGFVALLAIGWAWLSRRNNLAKPELFLMKFSLLIVVGATLCVFDYSLYFFTAQLPGFNAIRAVTRVILVLLFPISFLLGAWVDDLANRSRHRLACRVLAIALCIGCLVENLTTNIYYRVANWESRLTSLENLIHSTLQRPLQKNDVLVYAQPPDLSPSLFYQRNLDAMLVAQKLGIRTLNGYSGNIPPHYIDMRTTQDVVQVIKAGRQFTDRHRIPSADISNENLILVDFANVNREELAKIPDIPKITRSTTITHEAHPEMLQLLLGEGWKTPPSGPPRSNKLEAELLLRFATPGSKRIFLELKSFSPNAATERTIRVTTNGVFLKNIILKKPSKIKKHYLNLPAKMGESITLKMTVDSARDAALDSSSKSLRLRLYAIGME